jgi:hypothetical protein
MNVAPYSARPGTRSYVEAATNVAVLLGATAVLASLAAQAFREADIEADKRAAGGGRDSLLPAARRFFDGAVSPASAQH